MRVPFVERLVLKVEQLEPGQAPPSPMPGEVKYRTVDGGAPLCAQHAQELRDYLPGEEFRRVLTDDEITSYVTEFGLRREDLMHLHGTRIAETCCMCGTLDNHGALCANCEQPLHPHWPAVYCSTRCALEDL